MSNYPKINGVAVEYPENNNDNCTALIGKEYPKLLAKYLDNCQKTIDIIVFDWRWYVNNPASEVQQFSHRIVTAAKRGVKCRAITNCDDIIKILRSCKIDATKLITQRLVHTKMIIIDGKYTAIGSHNFTQNAFGLNIEASVLIDSESCAKQFTDYFNNLWPL